MLLNLSLKEEVLEETDAFKYLGAIVGKNGGFLEDVLNRVNEGAKVSGALSKVWRVRSLGINVKRMYLFICSCGWRCQKLLWG